MAKSNTREENWFGLAVPEDGSLKWPGGRDMLGGARSWLVIFFIHIQEAEKEKRKKGEVTKPQSLTPVMHFQQQSFTSYGLHNSHKQCPQPEYSSLWETFLINPPIHLLSLNSLLAISWSRMPPPPHLDRVSLCSLGLS